MRIYVCIWFKYNIISIRSKIWGIARAAEQTEIWLKWKWMNLSANEENFECVCVLAVYIAQLGRTTHRVEIAVRDFDL